MNKLFLRTCNQDGTSYEGFQWNLEVGGITEAPDWNPEPECGGGLHGLLHGKGDGENLDHSKDSLWMVCEALGPIVDIDHKIKTSKAKTLFVGDLKGATDFLIASGCNSAEVVGAFITGGDSSKIIGADWSTLTGGDGSILSLEWYDGKRTRISIAYVGEDGIEPNVPYKLDDNGKFVRA